MSLNGLSELIKPLLKLGLMGFAAYRTIMAEVESFVVLSARDVGSIAQYVGQSTLRVCVRAVYVMLALAVFAYAWQCWQFEKSLRMTGREIEEESKEGDPRSTLQLANVSQTALKSRHRNASSTSFSMSHNGMITHV